MLDEHVFVSDALRGNPLGDPHERPLWVWTPPEPGERYPSVYVLQGFTGQCGFSRLVLEGPSFTSFDMSVVKKVRFTERSNLEFRAEFLNAFNNINFQPGASGNDVNGLGNLTNAAFGRMTSAYQDLSTTNDPGGRVGQIVVRLNF